MTKPVINIKDLDGRSYYIAVYCPVCYASFGRVLASQLGRVLVSDHARAGSVGEPARAVDAATSDGPPCCPGSRQAAVTWGAK